MIDNWFCVESNATGSGSAIKKASPILAAGSFLIKALFQYSGQREAIRCFPLNGRAESPRRPETGIT
jgi:hypothetical protein